MIDRLLTRVACWVRGAYPEWAPRRGHMTLVALCGQDESLTEPTPHSVR